MGELGATRIAALPRLTEASRALTYARSLQEILEITVDCAVDLLGAGKALLLLLDDEGQLRVEAARNVDPASIERFREPLDERLSLRLTGLLGAEAEERFLGVPLVVRGAVTGVLAVLRASGGAMQESEEWLLSALADQASIAVEGARFGEVRQSSEARIAELERRGSLSSRALQVLGHDLRSPLSAIQGYVELLATGVYGPLDEPQREALARIQMIGRHLGSILNDVMDLNQFMAGRLAVRRRKLRVAPVLEESVSIVQPAALEKGIRLEVDTTPDLVVEADPDRLRQVLVHLLDNAVKYAPADTSVHLQGAWATEKGGEWAVLRVRDAGPGVDAEEREVIFQPYERGARVRGAVPGTGLGLTIARSLCEHMGGRLSLEPGSGAGACFAVRLPRSPPRQG